MAKKLSALSQRERQRHVKNGDIALTKARIKEIEALKQRKIDLSDNNASEIVNWEQAVIGKFYRPLKKQITIRIDADVLDWFKHSEKKYQSLINQVCRDYMKHQKTTQKSTKQKSA